MSTPDWMAAADALALHLKKQEPLAKAVEVFRQAGSAQQAADEAEARIAKANKESEAILARNAQAVAKHNADMDELTKAMEAKRAQGEIDGAALAATAKRRADQIVAKAEAEAAKATAKAEADQSRAADVLKEARTVADAINAEVKASEQKRKGLEAEIARLESVRDGFKAKLAAAMG